MRLWKQILDFYLDASIHVAVSVFCLTLITQSYFNLPPNLPLSLFLFFATIATYNFIKYGVEAEKYMLVSGTYQRGIQFFSFVCAGMAAYHASSLSLRVWMALVILGILVLLYALPVLPQARNLRHLGLLKVVMVAFVWTGCTVFLPFLAARQELATGEYVEGLQRLLFVLALIMPFEIRDLAFDKPGLRTLPQRIGVEKTRLLGGILSLLFLLATYLKPEVSRNEVLSKGMVAILLIGILGLGKKIQARYFASFWVEAVPVFWLLLLLGLGEWL